MGLNQKQLYELVQFAQNPTWLESLKKAIEEKRALIYRKTTNKSDSITQSQWHSARQRIEDGAWCDALQFVVDTVEGAEQKLINITKNHGKEKS